MASRPAAGGKTRIEAGDGFLTTTPVQITSATFTGLLVGARRPPTSRMSSDGLNPVRAVPGIGLPIADAA